MLVLVDNAFTVEVSKAKEVEDMTRRLVVDRYSVSQLVTKEVVGTRIVVARYAIERDVDGTMTVVA
jgi:hypothetical protein